MKKRLRIDGPVFVDLFAGCGGLSLGLEQAGFTPLFVNELNKDAMSTYLANRVDEFEWLEEYNEYDIKSLIKKGGKLYELKELFSDRFGVEDIDLVVGGPPCQGYSGIGHRRSYSVDKKHLPSNTLYEDMITVIDELRPRIFLFENVRGLLSARWTKDGEKGEIWEDVTNAFKQNLPSYQIRSALVYAKDYGVPQNRPRVLMVGVREDLGISPADTEESLVADGFLPEATKEYPDIIDLLGDLIEEPYPPGGKTTEYPSDAKPGSVQEYFRTDPETGSIKKKGDPLTEQEYSKHSAKIVRKFSYMIDNEGRVPPGMETKKFAQRVLPPDLPHLTGPVS